MQGVTTAIVAFLFVCVVFPRLVKNKPQWFAVLGMTIAIILLDTLAHMVGEGKLAVGCYALAGILQAVAILILVLCCGGLSVKDLASEMGRAYEVMRRGEEEKEIIIPLSKDAYRSTEQSYAAPAADAVPPVVRPRPARPDVDSSIPMD